MPSISQAKLDEMADAHESMARQAHELDQRARQAEERVRTFDAILDKVVRAAQGRPMDDHRDSGHYANMGAYMAEAGSTRKVKTTERQESEIRDLNGRIVDLEARLAAAVAVASFARAHKA